MWIGIVCYTFNGYFIIIVSLLYWVYYERIMFAEERFLEGKFGKRYLDWANELPAFLPKFSNLKKSTIPFSFVSVLRREYSGILATVIGFAYVSLLRNYIQYDSIFISETFSVLLISFALISIVLRTLKRHTKLLNEEGRS